MHASLSSSRFIPCLSFNPFFFFYFYSAICLFSFWNFLWSVFASFMWPKLDPDPPNSPCFFDFAKFLTSESASWSLAYCFNLYVYYLIFYYLRIFIKSFGDILVLLLYSRVLDLFVIVMELLFVFSKLEFIVFMVS